jgi:hypothetical protein
MIDIPEKFAKANPQYSQKQLVREEPLKLVIGAVENCVEEILDFRVPYLSIKRLNNSSIVRAVIAK